MRQFLFIKICTLIFVVSNLGAQDFEIGLIGGTNFNLVSISSDYQLEDEISYTPGFSYNAGASLKLKKEKTFAFLTLEYVRLSNRINPDFLFVDDNGNNITTGGYKHKLINHNLRISLSGNIKLYEGLFTGIGISGSYTFKSTLKFYNDWKEDLESAYDLQIDKSVNDESYRKFVFSIPVTIGYEFEYFDILLTFDKGIMNRLSAKDNFITEKNNTFFLSVNCRPFYK